MARTAEQQLRDEFTKYRDIIHKRVQRLEKAGLLKESALQRYENGIPKARDLTTKQIKQQLDIFKRTLNYKQTASLSGIREMKKEQARAVKEEGERLKARVKAERGPSIEDMEDSFEELMDKLIDYSHNLMNFLRALHLDKFMYMAKGQGQSGFDTMQDELLEWGGMKGKNYWQVTAKLLSQELAGYETGQLINEEMAKSHKNKAKIKELADTLNAELELENRRRKRK